MSMTKKRVFCTRLLQSELHGNPTAKQKYLRWVVDQFETIFVLTFDRTGQWVNGHEI
jgi:hypothetical protein